MKWNENAILTPTTASYVCADEYSLVAIRPFWMVDEDLFAPILQ